MVHSGESHWPAFVSQWPHLHLFRVCVSLRLPLRLCVSAVKSLLRYSRGADSPQRRKDAEVNAEKTKSRAPIRARAASGASIRRIGTRPFPLRTVRRRCAVPRSRTLFTLPDLQYLYAHPPLTESPRFGGRPQTQVDVRSVHLGSGIGHQI